MLSCFQLAFRLWSRDAAGVLGVGRGALKLIGALLAASAVALVVAITQTLGSVDTIMRDYDTEATRLAVRALSNGIAVSAIITGGLFSFLAGESSAMERLLKVAGAGRVERVAILALPTAVVALGVSWLLNVPTVVVLSAVGRTPLSTATLIVVGLWVTTCATAVGSGLNQLVVVLLTRLLRLPRVYAGVVALGIVLACALIVGWPLFAPATSRSFLRSGSPGEIIAILVDGLSAGDGKAIAGAVALSLMLAVVGLGLVVAGAGERADLSPPQSPTWSCGPPPRRRTTAMLIWYEFVSLGRAPTTLVSALGVGAATAAALIWRHVPVMPGLMVMLIATMIGALGLNATGLNIRSSWSVRVIVGRTLRLGVAKLVASLAVTLALFIPPVLALLPVVGIGDMALAFGYVAVPTLVATLLAGSLLPVDHQQPLTAVTAGALAILLGGGGPALTGLALRPLGVEAEQLAFPVLVAVGVAATIAVISHLSDELVVRRP